jgi:hypothetical protein
VNNLPFSISVDAVAWVQRMLRRAEEVPAVADLIPVLVLFSDYQLKDKEGRVIESYSGQFFDVGWYRPERVDGLGLVEIERLAPRVFVSPDTLETIKGKQLESVP